MAKGGDAGAAGNGWTARGGRPALFPPRGGGRRTVGPGLLRGLLLLLFLLFLLLLLGLLLLFVLGLLVLFREVELVGEPRLVILREFPLLVGDGDLRRVL